MLSAVLGEGSRGSWDGVESGPSASIDVLEIGPELLRPTESFNFNLVTDGNPRFAWAHFLQNTQVSEIEGGPRAELLREAKQDHQITILTNAVAGAGVVLVALIAVVVYLLQ